MRILFLHNNFPGQFKHLAAAMGRDPAHEVVFGTTRKDGEIEGVRRVVHRAARGIHGETHHYLRPMEKAVIHGEAVLRMAEVLRKEGFVPDVIYGHSGWGPTLFMKDLFPEAKLLCYFEWFYHSVDSDVDFDPSVKLSADDVARIRMKNGPILIDLEQCDRGLAPTRWQQGRFPAEWRRKIDVAHDGIDTEICKPNRGARLVLPRLGIDLREFSELVTYVAWGMEPYRGFPQFIKAVSLLQERRPGLHAVVVGHDRVAYGRQRTDGKTWKQDLLESTVLDLKRLHFPGMLPYEEYLKVLQASSAHVYLTRPFILSWSMLEAMACGCLVVASRTAPVQEVIEDEANGLLVDFFSPEAIAGRIAEALDNPDKMKPIRERARQHVIDHYDQRDLLPKHLAWIRET